MIYQPKVEKELYALRKMIAYHNQMAKDYPYQIQYKQTAPKPETMSGLFDDWEDFDLFEAIHDLQDAITEGFNHVIEEIGKALESIDWEHIGRELENVSHVIGAFIVEANPFHLVWMGLSTNPLTDHLARELDHLTGGAITSIDDISSLTGRAIRGDAIHEEELIQDALFAAKVAAVIISGGSAAGIIGATSDQLKQGTLGETELGRAVLSVATVTAGAIAFGGEVLTAAQHEATRQAMNGAKSEVIKHSPMADSEFGRAFINIAFAGTTSTLTGGTFGDSAISAARQQSAQLAANEVAKEMGVPVTSDMIEALYDAGNPPDITKIDVNKLPSGISAQSFFSAIERINLRNLTPGIGDISLDLPSFSSNSVSETNLKAKPIIEENEVDWTKTHIAPISVAGVGLSLPNPATPEGMEEIIKYWKLLKLLLYKRGKRALYSTSFKYGNNTLYVYMLDDGSFYYEWAEGILPLVLLGAGALGALWLLFSGKKEK